MQQASKQGEVGVSKNSCGLYASLDQPFCLKVKPRPAAHPEPKLQDFKGTLGYSSDTKLKRYAIPLRVLKGRLELP